MTFSIKLTEEALNDITGIVQWYDSQKHKLGNIFIEQINLAFISIERNPFSFTKFYKQVRKAALQKFPYIILFKIEN
ncbi:MAG: hypothetical protein ACM3H8_11490, partial [Sphingobacteriales bacterium]